MSIDRQIYVGPYLTVSGVSREFIFPYEHLIADGRGEEGVGEGFMYLIPNSAVPGINRPLEFGRHSEPIVAAFANDTISAEKAFFTEFVAEFAEAVLEAGANVVTHWGIVCGSF